MAPRILTCVIVLTGLGMSVSSCGTQGVEPHSKTGFEIVTAHPVEDNVVQWDPNDEPFLRLAISQDFPASRDTEITWRQDGLQLAQSRWQGPVMALDIDTPGCGYGGHSFEVTAKTPGPDSLTATVTVLMAPYLCPGSPWLD